MVDARDLKSLGACSVPVQVRASAPFFTMTYGIQAFAFILSEVYLKILNKLEGDQTVQPQHHHMIYLLLLPV